MDPLLDSFTSPGAFVSYLLNCAISGFLSNRSDAVLWDRLESFAKSRKQSIRPLVNPDVQRSVHVSFIHATLDACDQYEKELRLQSREGNAQRHRMFPPKRGDLNWLKDVRRSLKDDLKQIRSRDYVPPELVRSNHIEGLLEPWKPAGGQESALIVEVRTALINFLLDELTNYPGPPPDRFVQLIHEGWEKSPEGAVEIADVANVEEALSETDTAQHHVDWLDLVCVYFVEHIKTDDKVRTVLQGMRLEQIADQLEQVSNRIEVSQRRLARLRSEIRRRPFHLQHAALYVAQEVEQLIKEKLDLYIVGQSELWQQLEDFIDQRSQGRVLIVARPGFGKTTFLARWVGTPTERSYFIAYHFFGGPSTRSSVDAYRNLLRQLYTYYEFSEENIPSNESELRDAISALLA